MTKVSAAAFAAFLRERAQKKDGYIMGATGQNPAKWSTSSWWFTQYSGTQKTKALFWRTHAERVWDCQGLAEGYYKDITGNDINTRARNNYNEWCSPKGQGMIPTAQRVPGAAVFWGDKPSAITHVAFLVAPVSASDPGGDWIMVEARGVMYGVVETRLLSRKPNFWGLMNKYFDYSGAEKTPVLLQKGINNSEAVRDMQKALISIGYSLGSYGADGDFGAATEKALIAFQADSGLDQSGVYDAATQAALAKRTSAPVISVPEESNSATVNDGTWHVRTGPGTGYPSAEILRGGDKVTPIEMGGWQPILRNGAIVYISQNAIRED